MLHCASLLLRALPLLGTLGCRSLRPPLRLAGGKGLSRWSGRDERGGNDGQIEAHETLGCWKIYRMGISQVGRESRH
jgi:hypothetical protein